MVNSQLNLQLTYKNTVIFLCLYFAAEYAVFLHYFQFYHIFLGSADLLALAQYVITLLCFIFLQR